jgi:hypothetical protein
VVIAVVFKSALQILVAAGKEVRLTVVIVMILPFFDRDGEERVKVIGETPLSFINSPGMEEPPL